MTPGQSTSEFKGTLIALLVAAVPVMLEAFGKSNAEGMGKWGAVAAALAAGLYAISRGLTKAREEEAKGKALEVVTKLSPEERAAVLEKL